MVNIELDREEDGQWIAEIPLLPGCMVYGESKEEAISRVQTLALRIVADRSAAGESVPAEFLNFFRVAA